MTNITENLKNINFMTKERYDSLSEIKDDELYAVKFNSIDTEQVVNQNSNENPVKVWTGTRAEYNAIATKNPDTIYHITDDDNITQSLLETLYPVGAIYIGTMNACPLSVLFGTWQLVGTKILTDIPVTLEAKGNGKTLGINLTATGQGVDGQLGGASGGSGYANAIVTNTTTDPKIPFGVSTDSTKSGIVVDTNATSLTVNIWKRTA